MIIIKPKTSFLGVVFDMDHDFEGPRAPKAHLDTVLDKPVTPPGTLYYVFICRECVKAVDILPDYAYLKFYSHNKDQIPFRPKWPQA